MAQTKFEYPIRGIQGAIVPKGIIIRQKHFYSPDGVPAGLGPNEMYKVAKPRDYKKQPPIGREKANIELNQKAWKQAAEELQDSTSERYHYWLERFKAQLTKGEADAPIDPATGKHKIYHNFRAFVRTAIRRQMLTQKDYSPDAL